MKKDICGFRNLLDYKYLIKSETHIICYHAGFISPKNLRTDLMIPINCMDHL